MVKYGSRVRLRPGTQGKRLDPSELARNDVTRDIENLKNRAEHRKALGGGTGIWGVEALVEAGKERKGYTRVSKSARTINREVAAAMYKDAMMIVKQGMPRDTEKAAELTEIFGPNVIADLLELRRRHALGEI